MTKPKSPLKCSVGGCSNPRRGGRWCETHYYRMRRYGDLEKRARAKKYDRSKSLREHLVDKLLAGVRKLESGCWICETGQINPKTGYCQIAIQLTHGIEREYAHRLSYRHFKGPIPRGKHVLHSCDYRPCCNPEHLAAGTRKQNMEGMVERGRHYRGQNNRLPFLTDADVLMMYELYDSGTVSQYEIGRRFGVNERYVWLILHGKRWRHLYKARQSSDLVST